MDRINAFVSYSTAEKRLAGRLKSYLISYCGFDVFLAHDDIRLSTEWVNEVIGAINKSDYFIPLITQNFKGSEYTNQETGIALALKKKIIPIRVHMNPYGFIKKYQAFPYRQKEHPDGTVTDNLLQLATQIALLGTHYKDEVIHLKSTNSIIYALLTSRSFEISNTVIRIMCLLSNLSFDQIKLIDEAINQNNQVKGAFGLFELKEFLKQKYAVEVE